MMTAPGPVDAGWNGTLLGVLIGALVTGVVGLSLALRAERAKRVDWLRERKVEKYTAFLQAVRHVINDPSDANQQALDDAAGDLALLVDMEAAYVARCLVDVVRLEGVEPDHAERHPMMMAMVNVARSDAGVEKLPTTGKHWIPDSALLTKSASIARHPSRMRGKFGKGDEAK